MAGHNIIAFLVHALDLQGKRVGVAGEDVFGGGRGFGDFASAVEAAAQAVPEVAKEIVELFARFTKDELHVLGAAAGGVSTSDVHDGIAFVVAFEHGGRGEAVTAALAFFDFKLVVDFPVNDFRHEGELRFARLRGDLHFHGAEVDHQRVRDSVVGCPGFAVERSGIALFRGEAVEGIIEDDVAGDVAHAHLL